MNCPKCGHRMDLNKTIRKLRKRDAELAREGRLEVSNPELWPLHVRVKMNPDRLPEFVVRYAAAADVTVDELFGNSRLKRFVIPRHVLAWWVADNTHLTLQGVGQMFGRHHASIVHARTNVERLMSVHDRLIMFHVELTKQLAPVVWPQDLGIREPDVAG